MSPVGRRMTPTFVFCVSSRRMAVFWNRILCSDITGGMECKNGQLDIWEISGISGGMECNDGQLGVWEIGPAIKRSHAESLRKPRLRELLKIV